MTELNPQPQEPMRVLRGVRPLAMCLPANVRSPGTANRPEAGVWLRRSHQAEQLERQRDRAQLTIIGGQLATMWVMLRISVAEHAAKGALTPISPAPHGAASETDQAITVGCYGVGIGGPVWAAT